jgi:hypothetical protein
MKKTKADLLKLVEGQWQETFSRFIETGEAPQEFLDYMDSDPNCQRAVELAFSTQAEAFESVARNLGDLQGHSVQLRNPSRVEVVPVAEVSKGLREAKENRLKLNPVARGFEIVGRFSGKANAGRHEGRGKRHSRPEVSK